MPLTLSISGIALDFETQLEMYLHFPIVKELVYNYLFSRQNRSTTDTKISKVLYIKAFGIIKVLHKLEREILYFSTIPIFFSDKNFGACAFIFHYHVSPPC